LNPEPNSERREAEGPNHPECPDGKNDRSYVCIRIHSLILLGRESRRTKFGEDANS
jgi:hypothetical protein